VRQACPGVTSDQIRLLLLLYADDLVVFADSSAELQRALSYIREWSMAWRMPVSTGAGKTEALLWSTMMPQPPCPAPLQYAPGVLIQWVDTYKYLGYVTRRDLRDDGRNCAAQGAHGIHVER